MKLSEKKPEHIFLLLSSIFVGFMIFFMPLNRVPDETTHASFAWETIYDQDQGNFRWRGIIGYEPNIDKDDYIRLFTEKVDLSNEKHKFTFKIERVQHLPTIIGLWLGSIIYPSIGVMMTVGRIFNAVFYIVSLFWIIKYMKYGKHALVFISLLPIMVQQAASLSYDVPNFLAIAFFFAVVSDLVVNHILTIKRLRLVLLSILFLYLTKTNNLVLIFILPFIGIEFPKEMDYLNQLKAKFKHFCFKARYILVLIISIILLGIAIFYFRNKGGITHFSQVMLNTIFNPNLNGQLNTMLTIGMFGYIGYFQMQLPLWLIFIDIVVLAILLMASKQDELEVQSGCFYPVVSAMMLPLNILTIIGGMYFAWTPLVAGENSNISLGAQGRYFTPFLICLSPLFMKLQENVPIQTNRRFLNRLMIWTILFNMMLMLYLTALLYWYPNDAADWLIKLREAFN